MVPEELKTRSTEWLVQFALTCSDLDDERRWQAVTVLQDRGDREVFDAAVQLCASPERRYRELGVDVLGQNVASTKTFHDESVVAMLRLLEYEHDSGVLHSLGYALGHRGDPRCIEPLAALRTHPDADVRAGVVRGMLTHDDPLAVQTLIELSADTDSDVRNWATFGLGSQIDTDTSEIREALAHRLNDSDTETRGEAVVGLAVRHDERAVPAMLEDIRDGWDGLKVREAIEALPHPEVLAALELSISDEHPDWSTWARGVLAAARRSEATRTQTEGHVGDASPP